MLTAWEPHRGAKVIASSVRPVFIGSGLEFLWRAIVAGVASMFIIPIPWMYRWISQWLASQTVLAERGAHTNG